MFIIPVIVTSLFVMIVVIPPLEVLTQDVCELLYVRGFDTVVYSLDLDAKTRKREVINGVSVKRFRALIGDPFFLPPPSFLKELRNEKPAIFTFRWRYGIKKR